MSLRNALAVSVAAFGIALSSSAHAALVPDGDFSAPYAGAGFATYGSGASIGPWQVTQGSVDLIGGYWQSPTVGGGSVDLDGNSPGGISQTLSLAPGSYVLSFSLSGNPDAGQGTKSVLASVGGSAQDFFYTTGANTHEDMKYVTESLAFTVSGAEPTLLSFLSLDREGPYGAAIGNVSISAVPLPPALPLFAAAVLGIGAVGFYRRRQAI